MRDVHFGRGTHFWLWQVVKIGIIEKTGHCGKIRSEKSTLAATVGLGRGRMNGRTSISGSTSGISGCGYIRVGLDDYIDGQIVDILSTCGVHFFCDGQGNRTGNETIRFRGIRNRSTINAVTFQMSLRVRCSISTEMNEAIGQLRFRIS